MVGVDVADLETPRTVNATESPARDGFADAYAEHVVWCGRVAYLVVNDAELAQELAQEAFARLYGRWSQLRDHEAIRSYLRRTVINLAFHHFRKRGHERAYARRWLSGEPSIHAVMQPDVETREQLTDALGQLSPRQRAVVVLRYYEDLSERDIAATLGCPPGTVKSTLSRALKSLRIQMESSDHDE